MTQFLVGLALAVIIAYAAYRAHSLGKGGAYAAVLLGTVIFGLGGWEYGVLLLTFFFTSSSLSRSFKKHKRGLDEKYSKGDQRDAGQVLGNGSIPAIFAVLHFFFPNEMWTWLGFAASLAAVNGDTWATELGALNPTPPRLITNLRTVVEKGTSGGISLIGTLASLAGAALIGILASLLGPQPASVPTGMVVTVAGFAGALFDSFLGATVQAIYFCPKDNKETEQHPTHSCGAQTTQVRGWAWLNNDWVNVACGAFGVITYLLIQGVY
jgi:uncharacterized protein (TIGR00297 family)